MMPARNRMIPMGRVSRARAVLLLGMLFCLTMISGRETAPSPVPVNQEVSDLEARKKLAEWLSYSPDTRIEALRHYEQLLERDPGNSEMLMAVLRLYYQLGRTEAAMELVERHPELAERSATLWIQRADTALQRGHYLDARNHLSRAGAIDSSTGVIHEIARRRLAWGDFNGVVVDMRRLIEEGGGTPETREILAEALDASGRRVEAEGVLRSLLEEEQQGKTKRRQLLTRVLVNDKRFQSALKEVDQLLQLKPDSWPDRERKLRILVHLNAFDEALALYRDWIRDPGAPATMRLMPVRIAWKQGLPEKAMESLDRISPAAEIEKPITLWRYRLDDEKPYSALGKRAIERSDENPISLMEWATLLSDAGAYDEAIPLLEAAVEADPQAFPARFQLAELYGIAGRYGQSITYYEALLEEFPESSKLLVGMARVLSWSQAFEESLEKYRLARDRYPGDPEILREMARVAGWSKDYRRSWEYYLPFFEVSLDERLGLVTHTPDYLENPRAQSPYAVYESLEAGERPALDPADEAIKNLPFSGPHLDREVLYRLQKAAYLEFAAKRHAQELKYQRAEAAYSELIGFEPGNLEAWFELGQVRCALGIVSARDAAYEELLDISPLHKRAGQALMISGARHRPALRGRVRYWKEEGGERLASMRLRRATLGGLFFMTPQMEISGNIFDQMEDPMNPEFSEARARGFQITGGMVWDKTWSGSAGIEFKDYRDTMLESRSTGYLGIQANADDRFITRLRWSRDENLSNGEARDGEILVNRWELGMRIPMGRRWNFDLQGIAEDYSDDNDLLAFRVQPDWTITDYPRQLRANLSVEYRDMEETNQFVFVNGELDRIIHPYWTPQEYLGTQFSLIWRHDLQDKQFCGNLQNTYELRVDLSAGSDGNTGGGIEAAWYLDIDLHWRLEAQARLYRSGAWDNDTVTLQLQRHF